MEKKDEDGEKRGCEKTKALSDLGPVSESKISKLKVGIKTRAYLT